MSESAEDPEQRTGEARAGSAPSSGFSWRHHDHTRGRLLTSLFILALPLFATSVTQALFQLGDLAFVSQLGEDATTAVIVANQSVGQMFFMLTMGASVGAQALVARAIGESRGELADHITGQVLLLGVVLSAVVLGVGLVAPEPALRALNVSPEVLALGVPYLRLSLLLSFGFVFGMLVAGILNGAGDTTTPMWISIIQAVCALGAEYLLIFGRAGLPELGVAGIAVGMAIGQLVGLTLAARVIFGGHSRVHVKLQHLRPDPQALKMIVGVSWQPAVQMVGTFMVTVFFIRLIGEFGAKAQAAYSIGLRLGMVGPMLAFPLAGACATLVGQNLGAGNVPRAWRSLWVGLAVHCSLLWSVAAVLFFFRFPILRAFTEDPAVVELGATLMVYQAGSFVCFGLYFVFFRSLQGAGDVTVPMWISLGNALLINLPLGLWLSAEGGADMGPEGVFAAGLIGAALVTLATGLWVATGNWTRKRFG